MKKGKNRLFVPLTADSFWDFEERGKEVEIRKVMPNFSKKIIFTGSFNEKIQKYESEFGKECALSMGVNKKIFMLKINQQIPKKMLSTLAK